MSYRYKSSRRSYRPRSGAYTGRRKAYTKAYTRKTYRRTQKPRFAMVGFSRDTEKKYLDRSISVGLGGSVVGDNTSNNLGRGAAFRSNSTYYTQNFESTKATQTVSGDLLKGLNQGTSVITRIGNKISPKYLKGVISLNAAIALKPIATNGNQYGESVEEGITTATTSKQYVRTTWRIAIVKDVQVNSAGTDVQWSEVFKGTHAGTDEAASGVHAQLNINNMGRFVILSDRKYELDGDDPQKTINFSIAGSRIGNVRFNGPSADALTDKGIYVIAAAYVGGVMASSGTNDMILNGPLVSTRLCFTDQ